MHPRRSLIQKAAFNGNPGSDNFEPRRSLRLKEKAQDNQALYGSPILKNARKAVTKATETTLALLNTNRMDKTIMFKPTSPVHEEASNGNPKRDKFEPRRSLRLKEKAQNNQALYGSPILKNARKAVTKAKETTLALFNTNRMDKPSSPVHKAASIGNAEPDKFEPRRSLRLKEKAQNNQALYGSPLLKNVQKEKETNLPMSNRKPRKTMLTPTSLVQQAASNDNPEPDKFEAKPALNGSPILNKIEKTVTKAKEKTLALFNTNKMDKPTSPVHKTASNGNPEPDKFEPRRSLRLREKHALYRGPVLDKSLPFNQEADRSQVNYRYSEIRENILPMWDPEPVKLQSFQDSFSEQNQKNNYSRLGILGPLIVIIIVVSCQLLCTTFICLLSV